MIGPEILDLLPLGITGEMVYRTIEQLKPRMLSTAGVCAAFAGVNRRNRLKNQTDTPADLISYSLSTTGGTSGPAILETRADKLLGAPTSRLIYGAWLTIYLKEYI